MDQITPKEVKILESADDIQERREQVLSRYSDFKTEARNKREKLEDSRRFQVNFWHMLLICDIILFNNNK